MFPEILHFEIKYRLARPATYLYFAAVLIFTILCMAKGALHTAEKVYNNAPVILAFWMAGMSMMLTLVNSSVMGMALYRDIEYNTQTYYLTYPITRAGYFWGRYAGSFLFVILTGIAIPLGLLIGTKLGPALNWQPPTQYGSNWLSYYLYPFFIIVLPNLFFTASLFFGLTAITKNVKVIYTSGLLLFLFYFLSTFFITNTHNATIINLADPFAINIIRLKTSVMNAAAQNTVMIALEQELLINRLLWTSIGVLVLIYTYRRFSFADFFNPQKKVAIAEPSVEATFISESLPITTDFGKSYNSSTLATLIKTELLNIVRDNYFWVIMVCGALFLGFVFSHGTENFGVQNVPRTADLFEIFNDSFLLFIFFVLVFYTGETVHRDRLTRFSLIADSLPPATWMIGGSKLLSLFLLGLGISVALIPLGIITQLIMGYTQFDLPLYLIDIFTIILPKITVMIVFAFTVHVLVGNKFAAHILAIILWILLFFLLRSGILDYHLFLYSYTPMYMISDMNGIGHMLRPIYWFNTYWLLMAGILSVVAGLLYYRGIIYSAKERWNLAAERFTRKVRWITVLLLTAFLATGAYIYYNVSYLNNYLTQREGEQRTVRYEQQLKQYEHMPIPKITAIRLQADFFPEEQRYYIHAFLTMVNTTGQPIKNLLLNTGEMTTFQMKCNQQNMAVSYPLIYPRGGYNFFRAKQDTSNYRLYEFPGSLKPGEAAHLEINSFVEYKGFRNDFYALNLLNNGIFFTNAIPTFGYDDDQELLDPIARKKYHLPAREEEEIPQDDAAGRSTLRADNASYLYKFDITVSTASDQTVIAPGQLRKQWTAHDRNYFHYVQDDPGMYAPFAILSARFKIKQDSVLLNNGKKVNAAIYYHPTHNINIERFSAAYRDGLKYFSDIYGAYPFTDIRLAESSIYSPQATSFTTMDTYNETFGWLADFKHPDQLDYCYFVTALQLAQQWWRFQITPNHTAGSLVIPEGLAVYSALMLAEKKYGKDNIQPFLIHQAHIYLYMHNQLNEPERMLLKADKWFIWETKAGNILYGLRDLMGADALHAALRDFKEPYIFSSTPPFAGGNDLLNCLKTHVPDSLQYYLTDSWEKVTFYDNKILEWNATPSGQPNEYMVTLKLQARKVYLNKNNQPVPAESMQDYIDIGIFASPGKGPDGRTQTQPIYLQKYKLTAGIHTIKLLVKGKPSNAGIDPYNKLMDLNPDDNCKNL
jgi:hypothetical protein